MKTLAAVLDSPRSVLKVGEVQLDDPGPGELRVRIEAAGVCHTDLNVVDGISASPLPIILGHEGAGTVESVGPGVSLPVGARVALTWLAECGECESCERGLSHLCSEAWQRADAGTMLDGSSRLSRGGERLAHYSMLSTFAQHSVVAERCCVPLPDLVPFEVGALVSCAVMTGVGAVWNTASVQPSDRIAVFGCGGVGLAAIMGASALGADPIVAVDTVSEKVRGALSLGATAGVLSSGSSSEVANEVRRLSGGGVDFAFAAVGHPNVMLAAIESTRVGGAAVMIGITRDGAVLPVPAAVFREERRVLGSVYGSGKPHRDFPRIFEAYLDGRLALDKLISHRLHLGQIDEAFQLIRSGAARRVIVTGWRSGQHGEQR
jgi:Zn-dependent alcohol dehydrogenase